LGNTKAGFTFEGKIKRSDFGLNWNAALETGGVLVSDDVKIAGELQFVKG
jgi:polyisoprenoid-binding protein YceI